VLLPRILNVGFLIPLVSVDNTLAAAPAFMQRIPFWQWSLMLSLMFWLYSMSRWYPDSLGMAGGARETSGLSPEQG